MKVDCGKVSGDLREKQLTPFETAGCLLGMIEREGGIATLGVVDDIRVNLDGIDFSTADIARPEVLAELVLILREEIRTILIARRTVH